MLKVGGKVRRMEVLRVRQVLARARANEPIAVQTIALLGKASEESWGVLSRSNYNQGKEPKKSVASLTAARRSPGIST